MAATEAKPVLWYWSGLPGRGEMIRWALEDVGLSYEDKGLEKSTDDLLMKAMDGGALPPHDEQSIKPFSPPYLQIDGHLISHVANILSYLGEKYPGKLAPADSFGRHMVNSIQLTIADLVTEAHDTHHPIDVWLYYEDQKEEAAKRAQAFREKRIPKYLKYLSSVLGDKDWLVGTHCTYADLSTVQTLQGLLFAFPKTTEKVLNSHSNLKRLMERVEGRANIKEYLASERHQAFNQTGIYRRYPELDP